MPSRNSNGCTRFAGRRVRLLALLLLIVPPCGAAEAREIRVDHASGVLAASGSADSDLVGDAHQWLIRREAFIREAARRHRSLAPALPLSYRLDRDFVTAGRERRSVAVADDCGAAAICGVASDEFSQAWEIADLRALFTAPGEPPLWREAFAVALLGAFEREDVMGWAADVAAAGLADPRAFEGERRIVVPVLASLLRVLDPAHAMKSAEALARVRALTADDERRWREAVRGHRRPAAMRKRSPPLRGATFSVVNRLEGHIIANGSRLELERLRRVGYDAVALLPFGGQRGFEGTEIRWFDGPSGESDLSMALGAARAKKLGMRVLLKPHVWTMRRGGGDATRIEPGDWSAWFASYERFILHHALLARAIGADWFAVGTELTRSEGRPEWRPLIAKIRAVYHGSLTYAANFDAFEKTPFWDALDAVGVDAYFPLASGEEADDAALRRGAAAAMARMEAVAARVRRPLLITEVGYPSVAGA